MNRRNFIGRAIAAIGALVLGRQTATEETVDVDAVPVLKLADTTSMHNKKFKTCDVVDNIPPVDHITIDCDVVNIVHKGGSDDGYPTFAMIDGASPYIEANGNRLLEKTIEFSVSAMESPVVTVTYARRSSTGEHLGDVVANIRANYVSVHCDALEIRTHPQRSPCQILIGGLEPHVRDIHIRFEEGEACWVRMVFKPAPLEQGNDTPDSEAAVERHRAVVERLKNSHQDYMDGVRRYAALKGLEGIK